MKPVSQETRERMSRSAKLRCTAEWREVVSKRIRMDLPLAEVKELYEGGMSQTELAEHFSVSQKIIWGFMQRNNIKARKAVKRNQLGANNDNWKGDAAKYDAMHARLIRRFGQPKRCEVCGTTDKRKTYDWASLSGKYQDVNDYRRMCRSCHWKYDGVILNIKHMREKVVARG